VIVFRDPSEVPAGFGPSVVAIGKFDGVHSGHRAVLDRARVDAATGGARVVAVTFDRNPLALLRPEICPPNLIGVHQKIQLLAETGIDATLLLRFDAALANLTPREFVEHVLVDALGVRTVLVGRDFRFGRGGQR
jgi:riboflavin kinase/FMN adenylyltransferase